MRRLSSVKSLFISLATAVPLLLATTGCQTGSTPGEATEESASMEHKPITIWFDATANWSRLGSREEVAAMMDKCVDVGADIVVIDVKPISGYVLYDSKIAPRMTEWKGEVHDDPNFDLLAVACEEGHARGLKVLASMNVFSEGHLGSEEKGVPKHGTALENEKHRAWQAVDYVVPKGGDKPEFLPAEAGVRGFAIFISPANEEAVQYQMDILSEILTYPVDGVCLDRVRFSGITQDFSAAGRASFEKYLGHAVENWPTDIYSYQAVEQEIDTDAIADEGARAAKNAAKTFERVPGPLYKEWLAWRAHTIHDVMVRAHGIVKAEGKEMIFADYTGAWYPDYYNEGVNWASAKYDPSQDYDWANEDYQSAGYAEYLDIFYQGWYYTSMTEAEALEIGKPAYASIDGTEKLMETLIGDAADIHGGLYLYQYQDDPEAFVDFMKATYEKSDGLMLFDLVYLEEYGWWDEVKQAFPNRTK